MMKKDITGILNNIHDKEPEKVEAVCPACNGIGYITLMEGKLNKYLPTVTMCNRCQGAGAIKAGPLSQDIIYKEKKDTPLDVMEEEEREGLFPRLYRTGL